MKKQWIFAVLAPACLAAQDPGWMAAPGSDPVFTRMSQTRPVGQSGPVIGKPFSATEVRHSQQVLTDGTHVDHTDSTQFYRDDRGRMRAGNDTNILIFDPVGGFTYSLDVRGKTYSRTPARAEGTYSIAVTQNRTSTSYSYSSGGAPASKGQKQASVTEELPVQYINGARAKGSRITTTIPAGTFGNDHDIKIVTEHWYSDDLQVLLKSSNSDPRFGNSSYELTNLVLGPPNPSLFVVPADYTLKPNGPGTPNHPHPPMGQ
jgi:hypothetical protein